MSSLILKPRMERRRLRRAGRRHGGRAHQEGGREAGRRIPGCGRGYHEDRTPTHGYQPTREAAMAAFRPDLAAEVKLPQ